MNHLAGEQSPYLRQHADNPVDWYPWGEEALQRARQEQKPILVSIGYSACHWCHVMAHESFENPAIARLMNELFINIKVDREERPDVDAIYMEAVQLLTGQGGWPLNVFLTPEGLPFYGGTYFPPTPRHGLPSWPDVLRAVAEAYANSRGDVRHNAQLLTSHVQHAQAVRPTFEALNEEILRRVLALAQPQFDMVHGGFGGAPKFPQPLNLDLLLRLHRRFGDPAVLEFIQRTLHCMADGGIYDHLGGGFHRYAVDATWTVPHFEKMLYDNALLARTYLQAYQLTQDPFYRTVVEQTLDYILRDLRHPDGGFYSAQDADSEGVEGKYYVWTPAELERELGPEDAHLAALRFGVTPEGNFEGATILTVTRSVPELAAQLGIPEAEVQQRLASIRQRLLAARQERVPPGTDTKILVAWNALAIRALAEAGRVLERADYLEAAEGALRFIDSRMRPNGELVRSFQDGPSSVPAFLEDYAFLLEARITLYETTFRTEYFHQAVQTVPEMVDKFWDSDQGAFYDVAAGADPYLPVRPRGFFDNPIPSGNAAATSALLRLQALAGDERYEQWALPGLRTVRELAERAPLGFGAMLSALDFYLASATQIAIVGAPRDPATEALVRTVYGRYLPNRVIAVGQDQTVPLLAGRQRKNELPTAYVCRHFTCELPVTSPEALARQLA